MNNTLYIVVPCYNEQEVLPETSKRLKAKLEQLITAGKISEKSRVLFVNDGSKDRTWEIISALHQQSPLFCGVDLTRNRGHQNALLAGLMTAKDKADAVISMDADLQDDVEAVDQMVDKFLEAGFTYFDTAYGYLGGKSEEAVKTALVDRYPRESFQLATKATPWIGCESREDAVAQLETSLRKTGAGYFDFYLLHNLGEFRTHFFDQWGMWDWIAEKREQGLIKHAGFSFHSTPEELDELLGSVGNFGFSLKHADDEEDSDDSDKDEE